MSATSKALIQPAGVVIGDNSELIELILREPEGGLQMFVNSITESLFFEFDPDEQQISLNNIRSNAFLPPSSEHGSTIDIMAVLDLTQRSSQLEFLKLAVSLISNNLQSPEIISAMVDLCQDARNLVFLQQLLDQGLPSINAVAEKLLSSAAHHGNLELISLLVEHGVDADSKGLAVTGHHSQSPLESAIRTSREGNRKAIVKYLLDHGADPNQKTVGHYNYTGSLYYFSLLDFAVFQGDGTIVEELLNPRLESNHPPPVISLETICYATRYERPYVLDLLFKQAGVLHIPLNIDRSEKFQIIEMAAFHGNLEVIKYLLHRGFDINSSETDGYGSALVAAVFQEHTEVVHYLLSRSAGVNVNGVGLARGYNSIQYSHSYYGFTALQASLTRNNTEIARKLIRSGADLNYYGGSIYCTVAPIKLASRFCDAATVQLLLQKGADPNAPDIPRSSNLRQLRFQSAIDVSLKIRDLETRTALQIAFERGSAESVAIAKILIRSGANLPPLNNTEVWDPLLSAFIGGERQIVDLVLQQGDSIPDAQKYLQACLESGNSDLAWDLIDDQIFHLGRDTCSPGVICAAILNETDWNNKGFLHFLLSGTIEALGHLPMDFGSAALVAAANSKSADLIQTLLTAGARPCVQCEEIGSVLQDHPLLDAMNAFDAFFFDEDEFFDTSINLLIKACGSSKHQSSGQYYCHHALEVTFLKTCYNRWNIPELGQSVLTSLVDLGVDTNYSSDRFTSCSALQLYMNQFGVYDKMPEYLLRKGADPNCEARMGMDNLNCIPSISSPSIMRTDIRPFHTPLQAASRENDVPLLKLLIAHGAEVDAKPASTRGATALQFAAITGNFEVLNILLKEGANINAPRSEYKGRTAIEGAAEYGHLDMVCYLLEAGADVRGRENEQYRRSVYRAWDNHHRTLARVIQEFKTKRFGSGDICDIEKIVSSMTERELEGEEMESEIKDYESEFEGDVVDDWDGDHEIELESDVVEDQDN
jgi:ankyrin repeat protein